VAVIADGKIEENIFPGEKIVGPADSK